MPRASMFFTFAFAALVGCSSSNGPPSSDVHYATCTDDFDLLFEGQASARGVLTAGDTFYWVEDGNTATTSAIVGFTPNGKVGAVIQTPATAGRIEQLWIDGSDFLWLGSGALWRAPRTGGAVTRAFATTIIGSAWVKDATDLYSLTYAASAGGGTLTLQRQPIAGGAVQSLATLAVPATGPNAALYDGGDALFVSYGGALFQVAKTGGAVQQQLTIPPQTVVLGPQDATHFYAVDTEHARLEALALDGTSAPLWPDDGPPFLGSLVATGKDGTAYVGGYALDANHTQYPAFAAVHPGARGSLVSCTKYTGTIVTDVVVGDSGAYAVIQSDQKWGIVRLPH